MYSIIGLTAELNVNSGGKSNLSPNLPLKMVVCFACLEKTVPLNSRTWHLACWIYLLTSRNQFFEFDFFPFVGSRICIWWAKIMHFPCDASSFSFLIFSSIRHTRVWLQSGERKWEMVLKTPLVQQRVDESHSKSCFAKFCNYSCEHQEIWFWEVFQM